MKRWADVGALALLMILLLLWEGLSRGLGVSALVLPAPSVVALSLYKGLASGYLLPHLGVTLAELLLGLGLGALFGFGAGVLLAEWPAARAVLMPYIVVSQVVPKLALMPLFIVWFGFGLTSTVVITALICFFPLLENTLTGLSQVAPERLELFRMLGASRWKTLWRLKLPSGLPAVLAGLRIAVVLALGGAVVGAFVGTSRGLGALIIAAQGSMDTALMFAVLILISALGLLLYRATLWFERWLLHRLSL